MVTITNNTLLKNLKSKCKKVDLEKLKEQYKKVIKDANEAIKVFEYIFKNKNKYTKEERNEINLMFACFEGEISRLLYKLDAQSDISIYAQEDKKENKKKGKKS